MKLGYVLFVVLPMCVPSRADLTFSSSGDGSYTVTQDEWDVSLQRWKVKITATVTDDIGPDQLTVFVRAQDPLDSIEYIEVTAVRQGTSDGVVVLNVLPNAYPSDNIPILKSVTRHSSSTADLALGVDNVGQLGISGADPGQISVTTIATLAVKKNASISGYTGLIYAPITAAGGSPSAGNIDSIACDDHLLAAVWARDTITSIVAQGNIGASSAQVDITSEQGDIARIIGDAIHAHISATNSTKGRLQHIETRDPGPFTGSITARQLAGLGLNDSHAIFIRGHVQGSSAITLTQGLGAGSSDPTQMINIRDALQSGSTISIGTQILETGQIVINGCNDGFTWDGAVSVGGVTLSPKPYYSQTGMGGAVGLAPFRLFDADCAPPNGTIEQDQGRTSVILRFYGRLTTSGSMPVKVWRAELPWPVGDPTYVDVTSSFSASISGRKLTVSGPFDDPYQYKIEPVLSGGNTLKCLNVDGEPPVTDFDYILKILSGVP